MFKKRRTLFYIIIVCINALIASLPPFFLDVGGYEFQPGKAICLYTFEANIPYTIFIESAYIAFPLAVITRCYCAVFKEVYRTNKVFIQTQETANRVRANVQEAKVTKTLAAVMLAFVICWIPICIVDIIDAINGQPHLQRKVYLTYTALVFTSSLVNPFIYGILNRTFLYEYKKMLRDVICCRLCHPLQVVAPFKSDLVSPNEKEDAIRRQIHSGNYSNARTNAENDTVQNSGHSTSHLK
jgi:melatonin receptor type 1B